MAFPVVAARATGRSTTTNTTSHAITLPTGIVAGNLLVVVFASDSDPTVTIDTGVSGAGWNQLVQDTHGLGVTSNVFWKIATGGDALTLITSSAEQSSHASLRITGGVSVSGSSDVDLSSNSDPPYHAPPGGTQDYLWIVTRAGGSTVVATGAPAAYSNLQTRAAAGSGGASINTAERSLAAASQNPGPFTSASQEWVSFTLAVRPVPPAATGTAAGTLELTGSATGEVTGGGGGGGGGGTGLTWRYGGFTEAGWTSNSFTAVPIGDAAADRWVILALLVAPDTATGPSSVTIGGVAAVAHPGNTSGYAPAHVKFYKAAVPTGTTADVVIAHAGGGAWWSTISAWTVTGEPSFDDIAQDTTMVDGWPTRRVEVAIDIPAGGALVAFVRAPSLTTNPAERIWTGATERFYHATEVSAADADGFASAATGYAVIFDAAMAPVENTLGAASFSVAGSGGPSPAVGEATGTLPLSGSGAGQALVGGAGAGSLPLTGTATGKALVGGQAAGALPLPGAATGAAPAKGDAAGGLPLAGSGTGVAPVVGQASGVLPLSGAATGTTLIKGDTAGILPLSGAATAEVGATTTGQASGVLSLVGDATAVAPVQGAGVGELLISGAGAATSTVDAATGQAFGSLSLAGLAEGAITVRAQASGEVSITGSATGNVDVRATAQSEIGIFGSALGTQFVSKIRVHEKIPKAFYAGDQFVEKAYIGAIRIH